MKVVVELRARIQYAGVLKWNMSHMLFDRWVRRNKKRISPVVWDAETKEVATNVCCTQRQRIKAAERWRRQCLESTKWTQSQLWWMCKSTNDPVRSHHLQEEVINYSISVFNLTHSHVAVTWEFTLMMNVMKLAEIWFKVNIKCNYMGKFQHDISLNVCKGKNF